MKKQSRLKCLSAFDLKLFAMACMLCDHLWATVIPGHDWMTNLGRLAFPIFAFQIAEGYFHTHDFRRYLKRLFLFALISEIPYNLLVGGSFLYPFGQNVLFTFCLALLLIRLMEKARVKGPFLYVLAAAGCCLLGFLAGTLTMVDYFGYGVLTVFVFYFFHGRRFGWVGELAGMILIHGILYEGLSLEFTLGNWIITVPQQILSVFALIPIWLYNGKQGPHSRPVQYACYAFYPVHMLILSVLWLFVLNR